MAKTIASTIDVGRKAPAFILEDQHEKKHKLADYVGRWVALYFYPKDDTPGCTMQACNFRDSRARFSRAKAVILGISPDSAASHLKFAEKFDLPFTLLADPNRKVAAKYGVWREKVNYGRTYMGIVRTTYLIAPDGKVCHRWDKVKVAGHDQAVLDAIKAAKH